jgi:cyclophilin family peptidyl-prolyl cis-trans isomerase/HEAT repeat protein
MIFNYKYCLNKLKPRIILGIFIFIILIFHSKYSFSQILTDDIKAILSLQDTRKISGSGELNDFLNSKDFQTQKAAIIAVMNINDSNLAELTGNILLNSNETELREIAAIALGQIKCDASINILRKALYTEKSNSVLIKIIDALGKTGNQDDLDSIVNINSENDSINAAIVLSLARFGIRKLNIEWGISKITELSDKEDINTLRNCAYFISRGVPQKHMYCLKDIILKLIKTEDNITKMWAYSAMGKLQDSTVSKDLIDSFEKENDWRIKVNILNALNNFNNKDKIELFLRAATNENESISLSGLINLSKSGIDNNYPKLNDTNSVLNKIIEDNNYTYRQKIEAINCVASILKDKSQNTLFKIFCKSNDYNIKAACIKGFKYFDNGMVYRTVRDSISTDVQRYNKMNPNNTGALIGSEDLAKIYRAFLEMLLELDNKVNKKELNTFRLIYSEFAGSRDNILTDQSITGLLDSLYIPYRNETKQIILFELNSLTEKDDINMYQLLLYALGELDAKELIPDISKFLNSNKYDIAKAAADALKKITGNDFENQIKAEKYRTDFDWQLIENLKQIKSIGLVTTKGEIKIELFPESAPFTVQSFVKLAEKHYFDGTIFHRVVPNFVIQGGDPTGTGYSGPDYSIRTEISELSFETGYVGMASSGKDTEGSQFFITHSPQYHLDGKYTIFGKVIDGMDVVDKIQVGDNIVEIKINK